MNHEDLKEAIPLYTIGALDRAERQALESHLLTGCVTCHVLMKDYHSVAGLLPFALPAVTPPPKWKILAAVFQNSARKPESHAGDAVFVSSASWLNDRISSLVGLSLQPAFSLLLLILLAGTAWYAWTSESRIAQEAARRLQFESAFHDAATRTSALQQALMQHEQALAALKDDIAQRIGSISDTRIQLIERDVELDQARQELAKQERDITRLRKALAQREDILTLLYSAHVKVVSLAALEPAHDAAAFLLYDTEMKKAFFYAFNLPPLPPEKTYQLWATVDKPIAVETFRTDNGRNSRVVLNVLPDLSRITKFAVSVEPEGGRPEPTGTVYLAGQV